MADTPLAQTIRDAEIDARSLSEFISKDAEFMVARRLAPTVHTLDYYIAAFENVEGSLNAAIDTVAQNADVAIADIVQNKTTELDGAVARANAAADSVATSAANTAKTRIDKILSDAIKDSGFVIVDSFEDGASLTSATQALRDKATGKTYRWGGVLPKAVSASSTPETTGGFGLDAWVEVNDAALKQELSSPMGSWLVNNQMPPQAYGIPAVLSNVRTDINRFAPLDYFDGKLWCIRGGNIYSSIDMGETLDLAHTGKSPLGIMPTDDGEVIIQFANSLEKSIGWSTNPQTATWKTVLTLPAQEKGTPSYMLRWGFDGNGTKFIVNHYGDIGNIHSRCWISTDAGDTFNVVVDALEDYNNEWHMHGVCYDSWDDRFYLSMGHGNAAGIYYSDDDGQNWTKITEYSQEFEKVGASPTTMTATDFGIVLGTDWTPNGVYILRRSTNPDDLKLEFAGKWEESKTGLLGFAYRGFRDPETGIVYLCYYSDVVGADTVIMACGSGGAQVVARIPAKDASSKAILNNVVATQGKLVSYRINQSSSDWTTIFADLSQYTASNYTNQGNYQTKHFAPQTSVLLGLNACSKYHGSVVLGVEAQAPDSATDDRSDVVAVGHRATARGQSTVSIGKDSLATHQSTVIGTAARSSGSTAPHQNAVSIGYKALTNSAGNIAIGAESEAIGAASTVIGYNSKVSATYATAIGYGASCGNENSVAIGVNTKAGGQSVVIGSRASSTSWSSTVVGYTASAGSSSTAMGFEATANEPYTTSIGFRSKGSNSYSVYIGSLNNLSASGVAIGNQLTLSGTGVVVGNSAKATAGFSTVIGNNANVSNLYGTAVGQATSVTADNGTAFGRNALASHTSSIALGSDTRTVRASSLSVGNRDIESTKNGGAIYLKSPNGTLHKLTVSDEGELTVVIA